MNEFPDSYIAYMYVPKDLKAHYYLNIYIKKTQQKDKNER